MIRIASLALAAALAVASSSLAQDTQLSARAKGMGGSYTAFGDDPIAIWQNPAGTATQPSKFALSYQSFITYELDQTGVPVVPGRSQATLNDPQIQPSFLGLVVALGEEKLQHAFSFAFINPLNVHMTWIESGGGTTLETEQQSSRFRFGYAVDLRLVDGDQGWLTHIAVGGGIDWGSTKFQSSGLAFDDEESRFGAGAGILLTVYQNKDGFSVDVGASFNSGLDFDFNLPTTGGTSQPIMDWPAEWSVGIAVYISRLKVTATVQGVRWEDAVEGSTNAGHSDFENTTSFSAGAEYAIHVNDKVTAFIRGGFRNFDAPWDEEGLVAFGGATAQPVSVDRWALSIDTDDEAFGIGTVGAGIYWTDEDGKIQGFDFGLEFGGDKVTLAIGYVHEF